MSRHGFEPRRPWTTQIPYSPSNRPKTVFACEACGREFMPADEVVVAAHQLVATTGGLREVSQGRSALFHLAHWKEQPGYHKIGGGMLGDVVR